MTAHLTDAELRGFVGGVLGADDLLGADDHVATCAQCRARAIALRDAARQVDDLRAGLIAPTRHLTDEELQLVVQGRLPADPNDAVLAHLNHCSTCAEQLEDLRAWAEAAESGSTRTAQRFPTVRLGMLGLAAAVLLAVLIPAAIWQVRSGRQPTSPSLLGLEALAPPAQAKVRAAIDAGVAPLPDFMADLESPREVLMGSPAGRADAFDLVAPVATGTVSARPRFEWQPLTGAQSYSVTVFDERSNVVARSPIIARTDWIPADPIPRDRTYVWQVTARRGRDTITAPIAPAPPVRFRVVDAGTADVLQRMEAEHSESHLLLGVLNMEAGIRDAATKHLRQIQPTDAHAEMARKSLERLQALSTGRQAR